MKLRINNSQLAGAYLQNGYLHPEDLDYYTDMREYINLFTEQK